MIQMTLIQIDNYGPWTVTPRPRTESDLQMLQASLFADLNNHFGNKKGLVFFTRFDNLLAISNGLNEEDHLRIQRSIRNRYPITISMGVGAAETPHEAQKLATIALQKAGSAQSGERKEILAVDSLVSEEDSFVQAAHIDINSVTETLTDIESAFDTSFMVNKAQHYLMTKLIKKGALLFFIGGDNFMSPCNGLSEQDIEDIMVEIDEEIGIKLKAGIGRGKNAEDAAYMADIGLEEIRARILRDIMIRVVAPMAGITNANFLNKVIPLGFDVATLGGYSLDAPTIEASKKIIERGRAEFDFPLDEIFTHIQNEVNSIKSVHGNVKVSANVRATTTQPIIDVGNIKDLDIVEINCHCRQEEILAIGCGQEMLNRPDLSNFISQVVDNVDSEVSVKIRANVEGIDTLEIAKLVEDAGADYLHIDAMKKGVFEADWELLSEICNDVNIKVIGNNSVNSDENLKKMIDTGVDGFSIARSVISGNLDFNITNF